MARSGQGGESMQGMPVSRGGRRLPVADTVPCLGPPQAASDDRSQPLGQIQSHSEQTAIVLSLTCMR